MGNPPRPDWVRAPMPAVPAAVTMTAMTTEQGNRPGGVTAVLERPGARLVYEIAGDGLAVVLIHGFGLDLRMWDPQIGPLAARCRVVRYDCRGFGASGPLDPA